MLALLGDAYAASDREAAATPVYIRSYQTATTDEVMNYSLFAASKLLQKRGEWDKVAVLFSGFVKDKPDNPTVVSALYWIGKAKAHEGKTDEAKQLTADTIKKYITDPSRDAVEQLITQLAQFSVKKKRPGEIVAAASPDSVRARLPSSREQNSAACLPGRQRHLSHRQGAHSICQSRTRASMPRTGRGREEHRANRERV